MLQKEKVEVENNSGSKWTVREMAEEAGVQPTLIIKLINEGRIPGAELVSTPRGRGKYMIPKGRSILPPDNPGLGRPSKLQKYFILPGDQADEHPPPATVIGEGSMDILDELGIDPDKVLQNENVKALILVTR